MMNGSLEPWDPGLQPERTALAWRRTYLTATLCAIFLAVSALRSGQYLGVMVAAGIAILALIPAMNSPISGKMPHSQLLYSWSYLVRISVVVVALGLLGAGIAVSSVMT